MAVSPSVMHQRLNQHLAGFSPDRKRKEFRWSIGRIGRALPDFRVTASRQRVAKPGRTFQAVHG
jgi:hypothetical protein